MAIEYRKKRALLSEVVSVEDAEALLTWLLKYPKGALDLSACTHMHSASLQVLMAAQAVISAWPRDADLRAWLEPALTSKWS